ncbi:MAG: cytochrome c oxidase subunit 3 family protein [Phycisphaerales bacterium]
MTAIDTNPTPDAHGSDHDDHHDHPEHLAHHWESLEQQFEANKLGMWLFLATEFLLFGGLFVAYAVYRHKQPELFQYGSQFLDTKWGAINTVVLIASSFTMALGVWASQLGKRTLLLWMLALSFMGGLGFMSIKYVEYSHKFHDNIVWGPGLYESPKHSGHGDDHAAGGDHGDDADHGDDHGDGADHGDDDASHAGDADHDGDHSDNVPVFTLESDAPELPKTDAPEAGVIPSGGLVRAPELAPLIRNPKVGQHGHSGDDGHGKKSKPDPRKDVAGVDRPANAHIFFGIYFCMTGLHGIHVLIGMSVIAWLFFRAFRGDFGPDNFTPVDLGGLYWHVVDMIWIFLFPLLYLIH